METFGDRLRRLRLDADLTPSALAHMVDVTEGAIRQMESGQTKSASLLVGLRLAEALDVDVRYLALGDGAESAGTSLSDRVVALEKKVKAMEKRLRAK
jgi:transcriptional regulator with XRE-family HTH domain